MPTLLQGRIVYVTDAVPDPQGRNAKTNRPFVVVSTNEQIAHGDKIKLVGVSHSPVTAPDLAVELPYGDRCHTRLRSKSTAVCNWIIERDASMLEVRQGHVKPVQLLEILTKCAAYNVLPY